MNRLAIVFATWFGCGYFPWGPGTVGSLAAVLMAAGIETYAHQGRLFLLALTVVLLWPSIWAATRTARLLKREDPGMVVVDEVLGQWVTFLGTEKRNWKIYLCGFLLFRLFDIWKPWPVRKFEKLPEGVGIVTDDLAAGLYGALILFLGGVFKVF